MSHIFISYSHDDSQIVHKLANDLLDMNYPVWIDNLNLAGGDNWDKAILEAIDECSYFILVWSANIEGSSYSLKEKDRALAANKTIIPVYVSGDKERIWSDISRIQYIDLTDYRTGFQEVVKCIPLPQGVQRPPDIKELIRQENMTFKSALRLYRSSLSYGKEDNDFVGLLIERSEYGIQSFIVGQRSWQVKKQNKVIVFFNFSGNVDKDRFEDFIGYAKEVHPDSWLILVRGSILSTPRGLQYLLPDKKEIWNAAAQLAWRTIGKVSTDSVPLHLYMNAPVALGAGFCAMEHFRGEVFIYHTNFTPKQAKDRYFLVYQF